MKRYLFNALILAVGAIYMMAFLEIDVKSYKQTWDDPYDSYTITVKAETGTVAKPCIQKAAAAGESNLNFRLTNKPISAFLQPSSWKQPVTYRIYLRHAVFLI